MKPKTTSPPVKSTSLEKNFGFLERPSQSFSTFLLEIDFTPATRRPEKWFSHVLSSSACPSDQFELLSFTSQRRKSGVASNEFPVGARSPIVWRFRAAELFVLLSGRIQFFFWRST